MKLFCLAISKRKVGSKLPFRATGSVMLPSTTDPDEYLEAYREAREIQGHHGYEYLGDVFQVDDIRFCMPKKGVH